MIFALARAWGSRALLAASRIRVFNSFRVDDDEVEQSL
jgi:hypothetical protein